MFIGAAAKAWRAAYDSINIHFAVQAHTLLHYETRSKERLREAFTGYIRPKLAELLLTVKDNWQIFPIAENRYDKGGRALDYVGYKFYRKQKLIRKSIKKNFCRAAARLNRRRPTLPVKTYKQEVAPWLGWAQHSNSKHLLQTIIKKEYYGSIL